MHKIIQIIPVKYTDNDDVVVCGLDANGTLWYINWDSYNKVTWKKMMDSPRKIINQNDPTTN
jgi:hypothetical protein